MLILLDRGEGGYPHQYRLVNIVKTGISPVKLAERSCKMADTLKLGIQRIGAFRSIVQKIRADEICAIGVATARQPAHRVLSLRSIHSTAWEGAMAQR